MKSINLEKQHHVAPTNEDTRENQNVVVMFNVLILRVQ